MKRMLLFTTLTIVGVLTGYTGEASILQQTAYAQSNGTLTQTVTTIGRASDAAITPGSEVTKLEDGFSAVNYDGNYWFDDFLAQRGATNDAGAIDFLTRRMVTGESRSSLRTGGFGCSTLAVKSPTGEALSGRNFDWQPRETMVVRSRPEGAYTFASTVSMDFIRSGCGAGLSQLPDEVCTLIALYAPLDGMNGKSLAILVNMIQDYDAICQDTREPNLTTTTAIRLFLDRAANVEGILTLLGQYDVHSSMEVVVHFALADRGGRGMVMEYTDDEMVMVNTPAVANSYLAERREQGIGTARSHTWYERSMKRPAEGETIDVDQVRDVLDSVSKGNFGEFESTEWGIVFSLNDGGACYCHRENYGNNYMFSVNEEA